MHMFILKNINCILLYTYVFMFFCADDFSQPGKLVNALSETSYHFFLGTGHLA